jgi:hypothetical protein
MFKAWMDLAFASARLWQETQIVMSLRLLKLALGGATSQREAQRMVMEKGLAAFEAWGTLAAGGSMEDVLRRYGRRVSANKRRLSRR